MDELKWPRILNEVLTGRWYQLKNTLVMKDCVDHLIQKRVVTLDYWIGLKAKPVTESDRTEDFLSLVVKFSREKYALFLEALIECGRSDLVKDLTISPDGQGRKAKNNVKVFATDTVGKREKRESKISDSHKAPLTGKLQSQSVSEDNAQLPVSKKPESQPASEDGKSHPKYQEERPLSAKHNVVPGRQNKGPTENGSRQSKENTDRVNYKKEKSNVAISSEKAGKREMGVPQNAPLSTRAAANRDDGNSVHHQVQIREWEPAVQEQDEKDAKGQPDVAMVTGGLVSVKSAGSGRSREEILDMREEIVKAKESELKQRERKVSEQESELHRRETVVLTRENTLLGPQSDSGDSRGFSSTASSEVLLRAVKKMADAGTQSATTTQSSDVYADVVQATRLGQEVEDESLPQTTEFARLEDLKSIHQDIDDIRGEIATDRDNREGLGQKLAEHRAVVGELNKRLATLEEEREVLEKHLQAEIQRLRSELKNTSLQNKEAIAKIKREVQDKEVQCTKQRNELAEMKKISENLDKRVTVLEKDKKLATIEIQKLEKEVNQLQALLQKRESELLELRRELEESETEKEDLMDEVSELKAEVSRLKAEKKRLDQDKRALLNRCVVPQWNQSTRRSRKSSLNQ